MGREGARQIRTATSVSTPTTATGPPAPATATSAPTPTQTQIDHKFQNIYHFGRVLFIAGVLISSNDRHRILFAL